MIGLCVKKIIFMAGVVMLITPGIFAMSRCQSEDEYNQFVQKVSEDAITNCEHLDPIRGTVEPDLWNTYRLCDLISSDESRVKTLKKIFTKWGEKRILVLCAWFHGISLLEVSVCYGDVSSVKYLLSFPRVKKYFLNLKGWPDDVWPPSRDPMGGAVPLAKAMARGKLDVMKLLAKNGAVVCFPYLEKRLRNEEKRKKTFLAFKKWYENEYIKEKVDSGRIANLLLILKEKTLTDLVVNCKK
jgi:hypothetical protein